MHFNEIIAAGLEADFATFSAMIRGCCNAGEAEEAISYLNRMLKRGLRPDAPLFDSLLEGCASRNLLALTEQVLAHMEELNVRPSNCTLATLVKLYSSRGELMRAISVFEDIPKQYDLEPNAHSYGALISACLGHGRPDLALETYESMSSAKCYPGARTYERLIQSCLRLGNLDKAVALVDEALCLEPVERQGQDVNMRRAFIDPKTVEELLLLVGRRRESVRLGVPMIHRLQAANFEVSERIVEAILRASSERTSSTQGSPCIERAPGRAARAAELQRWRNFPSL